jgi:REP element-mobilizing transposase RayT
MSEKYKMYSPDKPYFITFTVVEWIDVFSKKEYVAILIDSLKYCQHQKGLVLFGYCIMPTHVHLIACANDTSSLSDILRDLKKYTSKAIVHEIQINNDKTAAMLLERFRAAAVPLKRIKNFKFWQDGNHPLEIYSSKVFYEKLGYIHANPVKAGLVGNPEDYIYSSARNYADMEYQLEIIKETPRLITYS